MLDIAKELQNNAVKQIISLLPYKNEIVFKAPTGSGKTHMMADLMNQILLRDKDVVFLVSTLSKGDLAKQNYEKFLEYSDNGEFSKIDSYLINTNNTGEGRLSIESGHNVYVLPRDLYKETSILARGALLNFLNMITMQKPFGKEKKVYLIKDECHIPTNNLEELRDTFFSKVINFSATPKLSRGQFPDVEIKEDEAINAKLIKKVEYFDNDKDYLEESLDKFEEIKVQYQKEFGINPCLIIQISDSQKAEEEILKIKDCFKKRKELQWMFIFDQKSSSKCDTNHAIKGKNLNIKEWAKEAKSNESTIDVIIFKQIITEGWDIPRACMLCQIRDTKSKQLDEQVIGRIRRNPKLLDFEKLTDKQKELVTTAYVWGNKPKDDKSLHQVKLYGNKIDNEIVNEIKLKTTVIKDFSKVCNIDVNGIINTAREKVNSQSIFDLYKKYSRANNEIQSLCRDYTKSINDWIKFSQNIDEINKKSNEIATNYTTMMEIAKDEDGNDIEVSFPFVSYYSDTNKTTETKIDNWVWQRTDGKNKFTFDSEAEKEWANILLDLIKVSSENIVKDVTLNEIIDSDGNHKYLIGKNYLMNSNIKYEYYLNGVHSSYPDFIMKDALGRIHIFETKSLNKSSSINFDINDYEDKVNALKECYKVASKLTGYYFYIPVLEGEKWQIHMMYDGEVKTINLRQFKEQLII